MSPLIVYKAKDIVIFDGDELEYTGSSVSIGKRTIRAFYSEEHTPRYEGYGSVTVRYDDYEYEPDDCHTLVLKNLIKRYREQPYDPTQMGDTDEDI